MKTVGALLLALELVALPGLAVAEEPQGFKEIRWGTPAAALEPACSMSDTFPDKVSREGYLVCLKHDSPIGAGGWLMKPSLLVTPAHGLAGYHVTVAHDAWVDFKAVVVTRFAKPQKMETRQYQNARGATFPGTVLAWSWPSGTTALLSERCGRFNLSCLTVTTPAWGQFTKENKDADLERAKRGF